MNIISNLKFCFLIGVVQLFLTVRNELLHCQQTRSFVKRFSDAGFIPYIAIADADQGRRSTILSEDFEIHIFQAIENELTEIIPDRDDLLEQYGLVHGISETFYMRPIIIGSGYRVNADDTFGDINKKTKAIEKDMQARVDLSRLVNPFGCYFPEPNLCLDAIFVLENNILFGPKSAEFCGLRTSIIAAFNSQFSETEEQGYEKESIWLMNRHQDRGKLVYPAFHLTTETDTKRLFKKTNQYDPQSVLQHHASTNTAKSVFLANRYLKDKNGGDSFVLLRDCIIDILNTFIDNEQDLAEVLLDLEQIIFALVNGVIEHPSQVDADLLHPMTAKFFDTIFDVYKKSLSIHENRTASDLVYSEYTVIDM